MAVLNGIDHLLQSQCAALKNKRVGLVCHQASITREGELILDALIRHETSARFELTAVFGPQHGIWGHTQDNMIEWEGYRDPRTGKNFFSLYGEHRQPTPEMLSGLDILIFDVQDVGSRYYTFIWSLFLCMKACEPLGIPILLLDRVNPIGGDITEGTVLAPEFASFVGLAPLPMRHGMTIGEIGVYFQNQFFPKVTLDIIRLSGWTRSQSFGETGLIWALPSPNMPSASTALVYPGQCLLEATNLSEGRGTTRPFEIWGAPFIDGWLLASKLNSANLPGVIFRPIQFQPTFQKWAQQVCQGCFIHVAEEQSFRPVETTVTLLSMVKDQYPDEFSWNEPPYEYEYEKLPIDILSGNTWLRESIEGGTSLPDIKTRMAAERYEFESIRRQYLLY